MPWNSGPRFGGLTITPRPRDRAARARRCRWRDRIVVASRACPAATQRLAQRGRRGLDDGGRAFRDRRRARDRGRGACRPASTTAARIWVPPRSRARTGLVDSGGTSEGRGIGSPFYQRPCAAPITAEAGATRVEAGPRRTRNDPRRPAGVVAQSDAERAPSGADREAGRDAGPRDRSRCGGSDRRMGAGPRV